MKRVNKSVVVLLSGCVLSLAAYAKPAFFDETGALVMKSAQQKPKVYQLKNISKQKLLLDLVNKPTGAQAGYASSLDPKNAAAFVYSGMQPALIWSCMVSNPPAAAQKVACNTVLNVSNYPTKSLSLKSADGNYWLVENKPQTEFKQAVKDALAKHK